MKKKEQRLWTVVACVVAVLLVLLIIPFARRQSTDAKDAILIADGSGEGRPGGLVARNGTGKGATSPVGGAKDGTKTPGTDAKGGDGKSGPGNAHAGDTKTSGTLGSGSLGPGGTIGSGSPGSGKSGSGSSSGDGGKSGSSGSTSGKGGDGEKPKDDGDEDGIANVGGHVRRGENPVPGARLSITGEADASVRHADTDENGAYGFESVPAGNYTIALLSPQSSSPRRSVTLAADEQRLGEDFTLPPAESITGRVVSKADGEGVPRARITVFSGSQMIGTVNGDEFGAFELMPLDPGGYLAKVQADNFVPGEFSVQPVAGTSPSPVEWKLDPSRSISGTVVLADGSPAGGASVALFGDGAAANSDPWAAAGTFLCDGAGNFRMSSLPTGISGFVRVGALRKESVPAYGEPLDPEQPNGFDNPVHITLPAGVRITGSIVDRNNKGLPGAQAQVVEGFANTAAIFQRFARPMPSGTADDNGAFRITAVEAGNAKVRFSAVGYTSVEKSVSVLSDPTDVGAVKLTSLDDAEAGRLAGIILTETGEPVVGADVYAKCLDCEGGGNAYMRTDSTGNFAFEEMPDGTYSITIAGSIMRKGVFIPISQVQAGSRPGQPANVIVFDHGQSIRARILDTNGNVVPRIRVGIAVRSDLPGGANGVQNTWEMRYDTEFQLSGGELNATDLLYGNASMTLSIPDGGSKEMPNVTVNAGGQTDLGDIRIGEGGAVSGRVVAEESGNGLGGVLVKALPPQGAPQTHPLAALSFTTLSGGDGAFTFNGLPAVDAADFSFEATGRVTAFKRNVAVPAGGTGDAGSTSMQQAGILRGLVQGPTGTGVSGILVRIGEIIVFTDTAGNYLSQNVPPGTANVTFQDRTGVLATVDQTAEIGPGETTTLNVTMLPKATE